MMMDRYCLVVSTWLENSCMQFYINFLKLYLISFLCEQLGKCFEKFNLKVEELKKGRQPVSERTPVCGSTPESGRHPCF